MMREKTPLESQQKFPSGLWGGIKEVLGNRKINRVVSSRPAPEEQVKKSL
jgi:hypothetical protein